MMKWLVILGMAFLALLFGAIAALVGGLPALAVAVLSLPLLLVLRDYRVGVVALTIVMPWTGSPLLPQAQGLNVINYLILLSLISLIVPRLFRGQKLVAVPKPVLLLFLLPVCIAMLVAWPHIPEATANFAGTPLAEGFERGLFVKIRFIKPLFLLVYAFLLANAVRDAKQPQRFLVALGFSVLLPSLVVYIAVVLAGGNLSALQSSRLFLSPFGLHANEFGLLIMTGCVPLLFIAGAAKGPARLFWLPLFFLVLGALVLTFSRGAWLGFAVALMLFLVYMRRPRYFIAVGLAGLIALAVAPHGVYERLGTGVEEIGSGQLHSIGAGEDDKLTAGRIGIWKMLAPEVARSPLWGRGLGSTAWSAAVRDGRYHATHPHNFYLAILMDLGLLGVVTLLPLYFLYLRHFRRLSRDPALPPLMQPYFAGAGAALVGVLTMGVSNGTYMPAPEQTFLWFSLGMLFGYWNRQPQGEAAPATRPPKPVLRARSFSYLRY
jgi:O-antigen ligase